MYLSVSLVLEMCHLILDFGGPLVEGRFEVALGDEEWPDGPDHAKEVLPHQFCHVAVPLVHWKE